jgi:hypothetical protein
MSPPSRPFGEAIVASVLPRVRYAPPTQEGCVPSGRPADFGWGSYGVDAVKTIVRLKFVPSIFTP